MAVVNAQYASRLIVALDVTNISDARQLIGKVGDSAGVWKIGLELLFSGGIALAQELVSQGKHVFIDAKLLDIPNTVERATASIVQLGGAFLTVHGTDRRTLEAAVRGRGNASMKLLAITVLTSLDRAGLDEQGTDLAAEELVLRRAQFARDAGFDGVVSAGVEARAIRKSCGEDFLIVTPGIRPAGAAVGDQARVMTPARAINAGADYLVVGRPITQAQDPGAAARAIAEEIEQALV